MGRHPPPRHRPHPGRAGSFPAAASPGPYPPPPAARRSLRPCGARRLSLLPCWYGGELPSPPAGRREREPAGASSAFVAGSTATFHRNYSVDRTGSARPGSRSSPIGGGRGASSRAGRAPGAAGPACSPAGGTCWRAAPARAR